MRCVCSALTTKEGKMTTTGTKCTRKYRQPPQVIGKLNHRFYEIKIDGCAGAEAKLPCHQNAGQKEMILGGNLLEGSKKRVL